MKLIRPLLFSVTLLASLAAAFFIMPASASAEYVEHNLIADSYYLDAASLSSQDIQNFLQARGGYIANYSPYSDRNGSNASASQIIYEAAQDYGISPKVILSTLQKEQSLVTAKNPTQSQLNFAMGYGCPDSAGCQAKYTGFYKQVDNATWQLRFNYERARGNTSWWREGLYYPCGGTTRYYSTGLYSGRNVTFYDDNGVAIKAFTINNPATASLYCYTPHPYNNPSGLYGNPQFGYTGQYYSGSFSFVRSYENWFGSTQPSLAMASALRVSSLPEGIFTGTPTTASFDLRNNTGSPLTINVAVTVRDANGGNYDFALKPVTVPPYAWASYTDTKTLSVEGSYTFGVTSLVNGMWSDTYPTSSYIDNPRIRTATVRAAPTITVSPASNLVDMRVGKAAVLSFTVRNNSAQAMDVGKVALALRGPGNANVDRPLRATGSLAAGASYAYSETFTPTVAGSYAGFVTFTGNDGATWNDSSYPVLAASMSRTIAFNVKQSPTLTAGPTLSVASPRVGQQVNASFKVKNFGSSSVSAGYIGLAIRDPQGRPVDAGGVEMTIGAGNEYTFQASKTFQTPGVHTAWITSYRNGAWDDVGYPSLETGAVVRRITFTVLPSPTLTAGPTLSVASPRVGQQVNASFKVKNFGSSSVSAGYIGLAIRDPQGRPVDAGGVEMTIGAGNEYTFQASKTFQTPGVHTAWITSYRNGAWDDVGYPVVESDAVARRITFNVLPSPTVTVGITSSTANPRVGQVITLFYKVKNYGTDTVDLGYLGLAGRDTVGRNVDPGIVAVSLAPNEEKTVSFTVTPVTAGVTRYFIISTKDFNSWGVGPVAEVSSISKIIDITIAP